MRKRYLSIWFPYLTTDWMTLRQPVLKDMPLVFFTAERGRKVISACNAVAVKEGVSVNMPLADAKAIVPGLQVFEDRIERKSKLLKAIGEWCIRYTPFVAADHSDGLFLDISGCAHLWNGEVSYLKEIITRLKSKGYQIRGAIADTPGAAWALCRFGKSGTIIERQAQTEALLELSPAALRLDHAVLARLQKLGLKQIGSFISMPRSVLRRRFGEGLLLRINQALGQEDEPLVPLHLPATYGERLSCLEPIKTAVGIEIAIKKLLEMLCKKLQSEGLGLRTAVLKCYRIDGKIIQTDIGTNIPSCHIAHLFKLFEIKIPQIAPALGIELFVMEAQRVEPISLSQEVLWANKSELNHQEVTELMDRLAAKVGIQCIHRYFPDAHYWPERSIKTVSSLMEHPEMSWRIDRPRPTHLLKRPEPVEVTAPIPDYPPLLFRYKDKVHHVKKADGPERIEREWWMDKGEHRDYYQIEDEHGQRFWLFRSGHYADHKSSDWFIHGYFA